MGRGRQSPTVKLLRENASGRSSPVDQLCRRGTAAAGDGDESFWLPLLQREVGRVHGTWSHLVRLGREGTLSFLQCGPFAQSWIE